MSSMNGGMSPHRPADDEPLARPAHDVLDFIDQTAARITDAEVDERLREILGRADHDRHTDLVQQADEDADFRVTRGKSLPHPPQAPFSRSFARQWRSSRGKASSLSPRTGCRLAPNPGRTDPRYHPAPASSSGSRTPGSSPSGHFRGCFRRAQRDPLSCGYSTSRTWTCRTGRRKDTGMTAPLCDRPTGPDYCRRAASLLV